MIQGNDKVTGRYLDGRYAEVYRHQGYPICTLKAAAPLDGDSLGYVIDDMKFSGMEFTMWRQRWRRSTGYIRRVGKVQKSRNTA